LVAAGISVIFLVYGFRSLNKLRTVKNIPTSKIRSVAMGLTEIKGTVSGEKTVKSPLTQTPCTFCMYDITERENNRSSMKYKVTQTGTTGNAFMLSDGTGTVPINPQGAEFIFKPSTIISKQKKQLLMKNIS
jgi:hypothetical protein